MKNDNAPHDAEYKVERHNNCAFYKKLNGSWMKWYAGYDDVPGMWLDAQKPRYISGRINMGAWLKKFGTKIH